MRGESMRQGAVSLVPSFFDGLEMWVSPLYGVKVPLVLFFRSYLHIDSWHESVVIKRFLGRGLR